MLDQGKSGTRGGKETWTEGGGKGEKGRSRKASGWEENPSRKKQHILGGEVKPLNPDFL